MTTAAKPPAFTLIELLVVLALISVLAALLLPALVTARHKARGAAMRSNLAQIQIAVGNYLTDYDHLPAPQLRLDKPAWGGYEAVALPVLIGSGYLGLRLHPATVPGPMDLAREIITSAENLPAFDTDPKVTLFTKGSLVQHADIIRDLYYDPEHPGWTGESRGMNVTVPYGPFGPNRGAVWLNADFGNPLYRLHEEIEIAVGWRGLDGRWDTLPPYTPDVPGYVSDPTKDEWLVYNRRHGWRPLTNKTLVRSPGG